MEIRPSTPDLFTFVTGKLFQIVMLMMNRKLSLNYLLNSNIIRTFSH